MAMVEDTPKSTTCHRHTVAAAKKSHRPMDDQTQYVNVPVAWAKTVGLFLSFSVCY